MNDREARYTWDEQNAPTVVEAGDGDVIDLDALMAGDDCDDSPDEEDNAVNDAASYRRATDEDGASSSTPRSEALHLYHALPVRIESRMGDVRSGITPSGEAWSNVMPADYGFVDMGIDGSDGDSIDAYVGPNPESNNVYVVDQYKLDGKTWDEVKVMLGYHTQESAVEDYMAGHHKSGDTFATVTPFTMPMFRKWLATADMTQPCSAELRK